MPMNASVSHVIFKCSVRMGKGENYVLKTGQGTCIIKAGNQMAELSRFFGIIIRMFAEHGGKHHTPHFHAVYQEYEAVFTINPVEILSGSMPKKQQSLVVAWAEIHLG